MAYVKNAIVMSVSEKIKRSLFVAFGTLFLVIGAIGIVIPILPTTPFLLLASACYVRGSDKLHHWMLHNRFFGEYLRKYLTKREMTVKNKAISIFFLWVTISFSILFLLKALLIQGFLFLIGVAVSLHLLRLPTAR